MKLDLSINRGMTINSCNYNSIKPNVSIIIKDVDIDKVKQVYEKISNVADSIFALEFIKLYDEMDTIKNNGLKNYREILENAVDVINKELSTFSEKDLEWALIFGLLEMNLKALMKWFYLLILRRSLKKLW